MSTLAISVSAQLLGDRSYRIDACRSTTWICEVRSSIRARRAAAGPIYERNRKSKAITYCSVATAPGRSVTRFSGLNMEHGKCPCNVKRPSTNQRGSERRPAPPPPGPRAAAGTPSVPAALPPSSPFPTPPLPTSPSLVCSLLSPYLPTYLPPSLSFYLPRYLSLATIPSAPFPSPSDAPSCASSLSPSLPSCLPSYLPPSLLPHFHVPSSLQTVISAVLLPISSEGGRERVGEREGLGTREGLQGCEARGERKRKGRRQKRREQGERHQRREVEGGRVKAR